MSSATPGSKANWGCASFTCAAWPKCKWKCSGPASPTTCNDGSDSANCKPQPPNKQRDREIQKLLAQKTNHVSATASPNLALSPARLFKDGFFTASVFEGWVLERNRQPSCHVVFKPFWMTHRHATLNCS